MRDIFFILNDINFKKSTGILLVEYGKGFSKELKSGTKIYIK